MEILFNIVPLNNPMFDSEMFSVMLTFKSELTKYMKDVETTIDMQRGIIIVNLIPDNYNIRYLYGGSWDDWADKIQEMLNEFDEVKNVYSKHSNFRLN